MTKYEDPKIEPKLGDEIPEHWAKQADLEIKNKYRIITLPSFREKKDVPIYIYHPTHGIETIAGEAYSKVFNRYLQDKDMLTKKAMEKLLDTKGIWGEEEEKLAESIRERMREIEFGVAKMRKKKNFNKATMNKYRIEWKSLRSDLQELLTEHSTILSNTVEGKAEDEERKVKLSYCVKYKDETRVWPTIEDLDKEDDRLSLIKIMQEAIMFWFGLTSEIIDELPVKILFGGEEKESEK